MSLALRTAGPDDADLLLALRNDPETIESSFTNRGVGREEHRAWFAARLESPDCAIYVVEDDGRPVGQVRLDMAGEGVAEVHVSIDSRFRGRGLGTAALRLLASGPERGLDATMLRARVTPGNERSRRAFLGAGFLVVEESADEIVLESGPIGTGLG